MRVPPHQDSLRVSVSAAFTRSPTASRTDTQQGLGERLLPLPESSSCRIMPSGYGHWHWGPTEQGWNPALRVPVMSPRDGSFISLSFGFQIVLGAAMVPSSGRRDES